MSSPPPAPDRPPLLVPFAAAVALAAAGLLAAVNVTDALGYGRDVHTLRAVAFVAPLFVGGLIAFRPGPLKRRGVVLLVAVAAAAAAWVEAGCRDGGPSLRTAAAKRNELKARLAPPAYDDIGAAGDLRREVESLAKDYPALGAGPRAQLAAWGSAAATVFAVQLRHTLPDDLPAVRAAQDKGRALGDAFPDRRPDVEAAVQDWALRAAGARSRELSNLAAGDWAGFERTAADRRALAEAFPATRTLLTAAEQEWGTRTASWVITATAGKPPKEVRAACREAVEQLTALAGLEATPGRFLAARRQLFGAAHEAARLEARGHIDAGRYDAAFTVSVSHAVEWAATTPLLTPADQKRVADLREGCRYLARLREKAGDPPEAAPPPRSREIAPEPRPRP